MRQLGLRIQLLNGAEVTVFKQNPTEEGTDVSFMRYHFICIPEMPCPVTMLL